MEDSAIIDLYWAREERALSETDAKYGGYCRSIAHNILKNREDSEECVSDTWLHAWNAMPPQRPSILSSFLGRITRNLSFDRCRRQNAEKRGGGSLPLALDELSECVPAPGRVEQALEARELAEAIDRFLRTLPERECSIFKWLDHRTTRKKSQISAGHCRACIVRIFLCDFSESSRCFAHLL